MQRRQLKTVLIRTVLDRSKDHSKDHIYWPTKVISCLCIGHLIMICRTTLMLCHVLVVIKHIQSVSHHNNTLQMLLLKLTLFLLNVFLLSCCNVYSDFCDTMETSSTSLPLRMTRDMDTSVSANMTKLEMASWVTGVLDNLFGAGYNKQFRPGTGLKPTQVEVNIAIRSMGPIDETQERYTLDCYFRSVEWLRGNLH